MLIMVVTFVLLPARGCPNARTTAQTRMHVDTVRAWQGRFAAAGGLPDLSDRRRSMRQFPLVTA
ncbi:hypothetical protein [Streptomyces eurythermus]